MCLSHRLKWNLSQSKEGYWESLRRTPQSWKNQCKSVGAMETKLLSSGCFTGVGFLFCLEKEVQRKVKGGVRDQVTRLILWDSQPALQNKELPIKIKCTARKQPKSWKLNFWYVTEMWFLYIRINKVLENFIISEMYPYQLHTFRIFWNRIHWMYMPQRLTHKQFCTIFTFYIFTWWHQNIIANSYISTTSYLKLHPKGWLWKINGTGTCGKNMKSDALACIPCAYL